MSTGPENVRPAEPDLSARMIPGERETRPPRPAGSMNGHVVPLGPSTMDAATIADRQREGGGSPLERTRGTSRAGGSHTGGIFGALRRLFS